MSDELRGPVATQMERLAADVLVGRHGDPHLAFAVLVYPDRAPAIILVRPDGSPIDLGKLRRGLGQPTEGRSFPMAEFEEAQWAIHNAWIELRHPGTGQPGEALTAGVARDWERRRMAPITRALAAAQEEVDRPAKCLHCGRRFTERGYKMQPGPVVVWPQGAGTAGGPG